MATDAEQQLLIDVSQHLVATRFLLNALFDQLRLQGMLDDRAVSIIFETAIDSARTSGNHVAADSLLEQFRTAVPGPGPR